MHFFFSFLIKLQCVSVLQAFFVSYNIRLYIIPTPLPAYPEIKTTVKIAKSKADIFKVLGSVPQSEIRGLGCFGLSYF